jgi:hypothetical protein
VRRRTLTLVVALLVAAAPAMALVCQLDCDAPMPSAQACHKAAAEPGTTHVGGVSHACGESHTAPAATFARADSRDVSAGSIAIVTSAATPFVFVADRQPLSLHGPPGASSLLSSPLDTILRI